MRTLAGPRPGSWSRSGPAVVAIGGGRGLATTLRAARGYASQVTGVVSTADDGGSTGRLRASMNLPATGDLRRCLAAMAGVESEPLGKALEFRFSGTELEGHALGNLILASLATVTGDFLTATQEMARLVGLDTRSWQVLPATAEVVTLHAVTLDGRDIHGQYAVSKTEGIVRVALHPREAKAPLGLAEKILQADQVVLGPGSVFTSILAAALVDDLRQALNDTSAEIVYVCNLEPEAAETQGFDVAAHVYALRTHGVRPDVVLVHEGGQLPIGTVQADVVLADLVASTADTHDSDKLCAALASLAERQECGGTLPTENEIAEVPG